MIVRREFICRRQDTMVRFWQWRLGYIGFTNRTLVRDEPMSINEHLLVSAYEPISSGESATHPPLPRGRCGGKEAPVLYPLWQIRTGKLHTRAGPRTMAAGLGLFWGERSTRRRHLPVRLRSHYCPAYFPNWVDGR